MKLFVTIIIIYLIYVLIKTELDYKKNNEDNNE